MGKDTNAILKNTCECWTTSSLLGRWQLAKTFSSRQELTWARAANPASQGLIMNIWLQWISNLVNQSHMPGSTWQRVKIPQDKCQRISRCGRFCGVWGYKMFPLGGRALGPRGWTSPEKALTGPWRRGGRIHSQIALACPRWEFWTASSYCQPLELAKNWFPVLHKPERQYCLPVAVKGRQIEVKKWYG